jgi:hypothetical protein
MPTGGWNANGISLRRKDNPSPVLQTGSFGNTSKEMSRDDIKVPGTVSFWVGV